MAVAGWKFAGINKHRSGCVPLPHSPLICMSLCVSLAGATLISLAPSPLSVPTSGTLCCFYPLPHILIRAICQAFAQLLWPLGSISWLPPLVPPSFELWALWGRELLRKGSSPAQPCPPHIIWDCEVFRCEHRWDGVTETFRSYLIFTQCPAMSRGRRVCGKGTKSVRYLVGLRWRGLWVSGAGCQTAWRVCPHLCPGL